MQHLARRQSKLSCSPKQDQLQKSPPIPYARCRLRSEADAKQHVKRRRKRQRDKLTPEEAAALPADLPSDVTAGDELAPWQASLPGLQLSVHLCRCSRHARQYTLAGRDAIRKPAPLQALLTFVH